LNEFLKSEGQFLLQMVELVELAELAIDEVMVTALLDRLLHHCHVINIKGRSYRLRGLERLSA